MAVQRTREQKQQRQIGGGTGLYTWSSPNGVTSPTEKKQPESTFVQPTSEAFLMDMKKTLFAFLAGLFVLVVVYLLQR